MLDDLDLLEAVLAPAIANPFGQRAIAQGAGDVRIGGQNLCASRAMAAGW